MVAENEMREEGYHQALDYIFFWLNQALDYMVLAIEVYVCICSTYMLSHHIVQYNRAEDCLYLIQKKKKKKDM
jgi:hypothetical protein